MFAGEKIRPPTTVEKLDAEVRKLAAQCTLESWNGLVEAVVIPNDLMPAFLTMRPELIAAAGRPRAMTKDEVAVLYRLIGTLFETNTALREHAKQVAKLVENWRSQFAGLESVGRQIEHFANFRAISEEDGQ